LNPANPFRRSRLPEALRRGGRPSFRSKKNLSRLQAPPPPVFESAPFDASPVDFATFDLDARLARAITDLGFTQTTPVQSAVFPTVAAGDDLIACAQTGTGKTVAFLLPSLQRLLATPAGRRGHRALILAPTRELAVQIEDDVRSLVKHTRLSGVTVCGGMSMGLQARALRAGVDIVVATPGRLLDHITNGMAKFDQLSVLVLDEADRMVDMGFWPDVRRIVETLPADRQTLLFSATTSHDVMKAAKDISDFTPELQRTFRAMQRYGLIVADNGSDMYVSGATDPRWDNDVLNPAFRALTADDFEVVQLGWRPETLPPPTNLRIIRN